MIETSFESSESLFNYMWSSDYFARRNDMVNAIDPVRKWVTPGHGDDNDTKDNSESFCQANGVTFIDTFGRSFAVQRVKILKNFFIGTASETYEQILNAEEEFIRVEVEVGFRKRRLFR